MSIEINSEEAGGLSAASARVRILDDTVVNQIAAGEVVERPASVVKELVENSLDAGATEISVVVGNGGRSSIDVIDNGKGMSREDALLAIERFGTSKIRTTADLEGVGTLGFRGEALPSIASVSKFRLQSQAEAHQGVEITIQGGRLRDVVSRELPKGTRIRVGSLFFNVPARKKFLRTANTELGHVKTLLQDFAAAYPTRRFTLVSEGQELACYPPVQGFSERVSELRLISGKPIRVSYQAGMGEEELQVNGVISQAISSVSSSSRLRLLVNGRSVRDRLLLRAVREGFGSFLKPGKYPTGVLSLSVPPKVVDVNVHPQKSEVRFRDPQLVFAAVVESIAEAIGSHSLSPQVIGGAPQVTGEAATASLDDAQSIQTRAPFRPSTSAAFSGTAVAERAHLTPQFSVTPAVPSSTPVEVATQQFSLNDNLELEGQSAPVSASLCEARYLGQVMNLYLLFEHDFQLVIVDMHAAHERVTFFRLKTQYLDGAIQSQGLLVPETIELGCEDLQRFDSVCDSLVHLGLDCERFGDNAIIVRSLPAMLGNLSAETLLRDLLSVPEWGNPNVVIDKAIDASLARLACHRSVRSGRQLGAEEAYSLVEALEQAEASSFCPHGRPVLIRLSEAELEAQFGRTQF